MKTKNYTLPAAWASALVNGDTSGLDPDEKAELAAWLETERPGECLTCSEISFPACFGEPPLLRGCLEYVFPGGKA